MHFVLLDCTFDKKILSFYNPLRNSFVKMKIIYFRLHFRQETEVIICAVYPLYLSLPLSALSQFAAANDDKTRSTSRGPAWSLTPSHISDLSGTIEGHLDILLHEFLPIPSKMTSVGSISLNV